VTNAIAERISNEVPGRLVKVNSKQRVYSVFGREFLIQKWEYRRELFYGLLSGYSRCCIEAYIRKHLLMRFAGSYDPEGPKYQQLWLRMRRALKKDRLQKRFDHVLCGKCYALYKSNGFKPVYYYCKKCDWKQFLKQHCNLCGLAGVRSLKKRKS
jgi:hypothetical protein